MTINDKIFHSDFLQRKIVLLTSKLFEAVLPKTMAADDDMDIPSLSRIFTLATALKAIQATTMVYAQLPELKNFLEKFDDLLANWQKD